MVGNIVLMENDQMFTTSMIIAEGTGIEHRSVIRLLQTHENTKTLSGFELRKVFTKGRPVEVAYLSELQATFIITLMKNSEKVVEFKEKITVEFFNMRNQLEEQKSILDSVGYMAAINALGKQQLALSIAGSKWGKAGSDIKKVKKYLNEKEAALNTIMQMTLDLQRRVKLELVA